MNPDSELEAELRQALRREAPAPDFTARVLARTTAPAPNRRRLRVLAALAACLLLLAGWQALRQRQAARQRAEAGRQLAQALRLAAGDWNRVQVQMQKLDDGGQ